MFALPALSIADLQARAGGIEWFESVAVVAEIASAVAALGDEARLPELAAFGLTASGEAAIAPRVASVDTAVRQLGRALDALIAESGAPEPLRQLATFATNAPDDERPDQFAAALHYYERPNRSQILRDLVARFVASDDGVDVEAELARLRQRASERAREQATHRPKRARHLARFLKSRWVIWPAVVALLAAAGAFAYWKVPATRTVASSALSWVKSLRPNPAPATDIGPSAKGVADAGERRRPSPSPVQPQASRPLAPVPDEATRAPDAPRAPSRAVATDGLQAGTLPASTLMTLVDEPAGPAPPEHAPPPDGVYTPATPGITPPVPLRQAIATEPDAASSQEAGVLELVIDETGSVERVRLVSSSGRFQDRMLLAAAKAWRFKPATLDGRPVRFRTQVRLTW